MGNEKMSEEKTKLKKYYRGTYLIGFAVFLLIAILVFVSDFERIFRLDKDIEADMVNKGKTPMKGDYVSMVIDKDTSIRPYANANYKLYGFIPSGRVYYYIVQLENGKYISVSVRKKLAKQLDDIKAGRRKKGVTVYGEIDSLNEQILDHYNNTIRVYGLNDEDANGFYTFTIDTTDRLIVDLIIIVISIIAAVVFMIFFVKATIIRNSITKKQEP
ncbi:DUF6709 family protein [Eubacterium ruminantium]|uniref:DUF6709 family protein n=2 Tax=Eubacterium ruminantium TaxID=42322 RepID=UPI00247949D7|nr:DUF6709 family protein [Eubacterium ruminantium]